MDIQNVGLAMKVQLTLQRKSLDQQASNILELIQGVAGNEESPSGRNDLLGKVVDKRA